MLNCSGINVSVNVSKTFMLRYNMLLVESPKYHLSATLLKYDPSCSVWQNYDLYDLYCRARLRSNVGIVILCSFCAEFTLEVGDESSKHTTVKVLKFLYDFVSGTPLNPLACLYMAPAADA